MMMEVRKTKHRLDELRFTDFNDELKSFRCQSKCANFSFDMKGKDLFADYRFRAIK